jgi:RimJ/RimL family protein N-acetyltransferase
MSSDRTPRVDWPLSDSKLSAMAPSEVQITEHAPTLATFFNEPHNRYMMGNTVCMTSSDVIRHYADLKASGGIPFLLFVDGALVGDADFRHPAHGWVEFAIVLGPRQTQGKGLGTRFAIMLHAWAFFRLGVERILVTILPHNQASLRLFEKLGHRPDISLDAHAFAEDASDYVLSISREEFHACHAAALPNIQFF